MTFLYRLRNFTIFGTVASFGVFNYCMLYPDTRIKMEKYFEYMKQTNIDHYRDGDDGSV
jgi:hypothetical protein